MAMNDEQIRALIKSEIQQASSASRFQLTPTTRHVHNGVDAPFVYLPYTIYVGWIPYDGDVNGIIQSILPTGWTVTHDATGEYRIFHNLGTYAYVTVGDTTQGTNVVATPVISQFDNEVDFFWFEDASGSDVDVTFTFVMYVLNNPGNEFPTYTTNRIIT